MNFLVIILTVIAVHYGEWLSSIQRDEWFKKSLQFVQGIFSSTFGNAGIWLPFVFVVILPVLLFIVLLLKLSDYWWLLFVLNLLVLLYAIGRGSWRQECSNWVSLFSVESPEQLQENLSQSTEKAEQALVGCDAEEVWQQAREDVLYHQLSGFYAVVFWFFLLGAPAALFYRLLCLYQQCYTAAQESIVNEDADAGEESNADSSSDEDNKNSEASDASGLADVGQLLWLVEWLPVRLVALLFGLVGNFATSIWVLQQVIRDTTTSSAGVLGRCADAALFLDRPKEDVDSMGEMASESLESKSIDVMHGYCVELEVLLRRIEIAFLVTIAVVTLF